MSGIGTLVLMITLFTCAQILLNLQRRSIVGEIVMNAVTSAARFNGDQAAEEARLKRLLGARAVVDFQTDGNDLVLEVRVPGIAFLDVGPLNKLSSISVVARSRYEEFIE